MPTDRVSIRRVYGSPTRRPGITSWVIDAETDEPRLVQYETANDFAASLCQRAERLGKLADVTWKDSRFGKEITFVHLQEAVPA